MAMIKYTTGQDDTCQFKKPHMHITNRVADMFSPSLHHCYFQNDCLVLSQNTRRKLVIRNKK